MLAVPWHAYKDSVLPTTESVAIYVRPALNTFVNRNHNRNRPLRYILSSDGALLQSKMVTTLDSEVDLSDLLRVAPWVQLLNCIFRVRLRRMCGYCAVFCSRCDAAAAAAPRASSLAIRDFQYSLATKCTDCLLYVPITPRI